MTNERSAPAYGVNDPIRVPGNVFRVQALLGSGGMADVYKVLDHKMKASCVLKVLKKSAAGSAFVVRGFENESKVISRISHNNVVRVYNGDRTENGELCYQMELLHGMSLADYAAQRRAPALRVYSALDLGIQLMRGLRVVHDHGVIHRDIKPHNLIIHRADDDQFLKIIDFGVMKLLEDGVSQTFVGTPAYSSPEQILCTEETTSVDIFSAGVVLFELLTGHRPYKDVSRLPDLVGRAFVEAPSLSVYGGAFPPKLVELVAAMLALDAAKRPKAREVHDVLVPMKRVLPGNDDQRLVTVPEGLGHDPTANAVQQITRADLESPTDPDGRDFSFLAHEHKERERAEFLGAPLAAATASELGATEPGVVQATQRVRVRTNEDDVLPFETTRQGDFSLEAYARMRAAVIATQQAPQAPIALAPARAAAAMTVERRPSAAPAARLRATDTAPTSAAPPTPLPESIVKQAITPRPPMQNHTAPMPAPVPASRAPSMHEGLAGGSPRPPIADARTPVPSRPQKLVPGRDAIPKSSTRRTTGGHVLAVLVGLLLALAALGMAWLKVRH
jgi:serine/threonine protein kinase